MNIAADLDRMASARPEHPVLHFEGLGSPWTFAELDEHASRVATGLEALGVHPGDRVAIVMQNVPRHVAAWLGAVKAGMVPVDVNFILGDEEWRYILSDAGPSAIFASAAFLDRLVALAGALDPSPPIYVAGGDTAALPAGVWAFESLGEGTAARPAVDRPDDELAVIAYTSGTTGVPKGVMHSHGALRVHLDVVQEMLDVTADDVMVQCLPLFPLHGMLTCGPGTAIHTGCSVVLLPRFDPPTFAAASRRHGITSGVVTPAMVVGLLQLPEQERPVLDRCRQLQSGGAALHPEVRDRFESTFGVTLLQGFGATEIMGGIAMERIGRRAPWGSCGELMPGAAGLVRLVDEGGKDVGSGEVGEFTVHRSGALLGYWQRPDLTEEAYNGGDWFALGDIGRIDDDGFVYVLDRKKDMIIRGGFNIYSAEIERVLNEHDAVTEATVVAVPHARLGEVPKALIVPQAGVEPSEGLAEELCTYVKARLGSLKVPEQIEFVAFGDLPRNAIGKVLKRELRAVTAT